MTAMARPLRITVNMPHKQLLLPTTLQRVPKRQPVQPSAPPPPYLLGIRPKATAKASGGGGASSCGAKRGAVGTKGKGAAVKDTSKAAKINLTEYLARHQLKRIRREWHAQFEVVAHDILDTWKKCTKSPRYRCQEEWPPELLNSFAKRLVDLFVVLVHTGEEVGVRTYKATRHLTRRRVQAQKKFARTTQNRMNHEQTTNNTAQGHDAGHDENSLKPPRRRRPRGGKNKWWYAQLYRDVWKR